MQSYYLNIYLKTGNESAGKIKTTEHLGFSYNKKKNEVTKLTYYRKSLRKFWEAIKLMFCTGNGSIILVENQKENY